MRSESLLNSGRRWSVSKEPFAQERLYGFIRIGKEYMQTYPEVPAIIAVGSLLRTRTPEEALRIRGTADKAGPRLDSDIDANIFVRVDDIQSQYGGEEIVQIKHNPDGSSSVHLRKDVGERYRESFVTRLKDELGLIDEQVQDIGVVAISYGLIDRVVADLVEALKRWDAYEAGTISEKPLHPVASHLLRDMFYFAVGNGLHPYHKYLLDQLTKMGELGERVWQEIIWRLEFSEQGEVTGETKYPRTLKKAHKMYG